MSVSVCVCVCVCVCVREKGIWHTMHTDRSDKIRYRRILAQVQKEVSTLLHSHGSGAVGRRSPRCVFDPPPARLTAAMSASAAAADSAIGLAITAGGGTFLGPGLASGMSEAEVFERLNAWGIARDSDLLDLSSPRPSSRLARRC